MDTGRSSIDIVTAPGNAKLRLSSMSHSSMSSLAVGERAPQIVGTTELGRFFSLEVQAGRPAVLLLLRSDDAQAARALLHALAETAEPRLRQAGVDLVPLAALDAAFVRAFADDEERRGQIVYTTDVEGPAAGEHPLAVFLDRSGRIAHIAPISCAYDLIEALGAAAPFLRSEAARLCVSSAPVLIIPNLLTPSQCQALIAHFETSAHKAGVMASVRDGQAWVKTDESKKLRREIELAEDSEPHRLILNVLAEQCAPEIKRAFQADMAHADRILLARYDDTGGYFKRHKDNAAPQTAFREFAISLNLNTQDYEGGELLFPEFNDHRYNPPAGAAIIFSASLLHEAAPVTKGSRYVALSFLSSAAALERFIG